MYIETPCKWMQQTITKEYKSRPDWRGKVIHWELCNRSNFDHTTNPSAKKGGDTGSIFSEALKVLI